MSTPTIALLRKSGQLVLASVRVGADNRLWAVGADRKPYRYSPQQVVWETGFHVDDAALPGWIAEAERMAAELDAAEAWEVAAEEVPALQLSDLAGLVCQPPVSEQQQAALLLHLATADVSLFALEPPLLRPRTRDDVARQAERRRERAEAAREEGDFIAWMAGERPGDAAVLTPTQERWLDALRDYAAGVAGAATEGRALRPLIRRLGGVDPQRAVFEALVARGALDSDENLTLRRLRVPLAFGSDALEAASAPADPAADRTRRDLTALDVFTIDEASTVDMDDALSLRAVDGGWEIGVHIADAAALVPPAGALDDAGRERMTSLYLPETTLPMLPPALSHDRGSVTPDADRRAVSLLTRWDADGNLAAWEVCRSMVRSRRRWSYVEADTALESGVGPDADTLAQLQRIAGALRERRLADGALEMARPEVRVSVDADKRVAVAVTPVPTPARRMVAEYMVLANRLVGEWLRDRGIPAIYRSQEPVSLDNVPDTSVEPVRQYHLLRQIRPARLTLTPARHALIGVTPYVQATSPLRRYLDLVVQRQLAATIDGAPLPYAEDDLRGIIGAADAVLRDLGRAEDERRRHWLLRHLEGHIGETLDAVVLDARDRQSLVELDTYLLRSSLYLPPGVQPGQRVQLVLQEVDVWRGQTRLRYDG